MHTFMVLIVIHPSVQLSLTLIYLWRPKLFYCQAVNLFISAVKFKMSFFYQMALKNLCMVWRSMKCIPDGPHGFILDRLEPVYIWTIDCRGHAAPVELLIIPHGDKENRAQQPDCLCPHLLRTSVLIFMRDSAPAGVGAVANNSHVHSTFNVVNVEFMFVDQSEVHLNQLF